MTQLSFRLLPFSALDVASLYAILRLRSEVFVVEQACAYQDMDGLDDRSLHLLGEASCGTLEAYARLLPPGLAHPDHPSIGRVITSRRVRGTGTGRRLMREAIASVAKNWGPGVSMVLSAQDQALPFYRKLGFQVSGPGYLEDDIPHTPMILYPLDRRPGAGPT